MSEVNKMRVQATTAVIGLSCLVLAMGAPWKFG